MHLVKSGFLETKESISEKKPFPVYLSFNDVRLVAKSRKGCRIVLKHYTNESKIPEIFFLDKNDSILLMLSSTSILSVECILNRRSGNIPCGVCIIPAFLLQQL
eukprot:GDKJ01020197.1.p1 GENE.GDKJ01020197.1~~GDKJ01020197.1.p1  ORF type:complete len:104 (+),score=8.88 GDKJ01020197.1:23-334(+)